MSEQEKENIEIEALSEEELIEADQESIPEEASEPEQEPQQTAPITWEDLLAGAPQIDISDAVAQLVNEYKDAIKARDEAEDRALRSAAEFANARRRAEQRADNQVRSARERVLAEILPVVDDFGRAFQVVPEDQRETSWMGGFELIQRKLAGVLIREGVTMIEADGEPFDPNLHQAVMVEDVEGVESGSVVEVLQPGYMLDDRVLRPAMVKVAQ